MVARFTFAFACFFVALDCFTSSGLPYWAQIIGGLCWLYWMVAACFWRPR